MNDVELNGQIAQMIQANPVADMLEAFAREARAGKIISVAIVAVFPNNGFGTNYTPIALGGLHMGLAAVSKHVLETAITPPKQSSIIPARMG